MAGKLCSLCSALCSVLAVFLVVSFPRSCYGQNGPQYPGTAGSPILSEVMQELSDAKQMMLTTNDQLQKAEDSVSRLYQGLVGKGFQGHKLVHLDLSGAPPKMSYLLQMVSYVKSLGGTGFLMEYVDTYPFQNDLSIIRGNDVYSEDEIRQFLQECEKNQMIVIPLVQTFGHLEYVLKHPQYASLRETQKYTNSICPKNPNSLVLIKKMIDQVLRLHPSSQYIHIGGDEVWNLKTCSKCKNSSESNSDIFLGHMIPVLQYVKLKGKTPIMWDDMMRDWGIEKLQKMSELVEPMLWGYRTPLSQHFPEDTWTRYNAIFTKVWMASAFKGAYKSNANFVRISVRLQNNLDWVRATAKLPNVTVNGLALTGWSRYDYFGSLCELLPASIPSLAVCLTAVNKGYMDDKVLADVSKFLGLKKTIDIDADYVMRPNECEATFPGKQVYKMVCQLSLALHKLDLSTDTQNTWILPRQLKTNEVSYFRLMFGKSISQSAITFLNKLKTDAAGPLSDLYSNYTIQEWIQDKVNENLAAAHTVNNNFLSALKHYEDAMKNVQISMDKKPTGQAVPGNGTNGGGKNSNGGDDKLAQEAATKQQQVQEVQQKLQQAKLLLVQIKQNKKPNDNQQQQHPAATDEQDELEEMQEDQANQEQHDQQQHQLEEQQLFFQHKQQQQQQQQQQQSEAIAEQDRHQNPQLQQQLFFQQKQKQQQQNFDQSLVQQVGNGGEQKKVSTDQGQGLNPQQNGDGHNNKLQQEQREQQLQQLYGRKPNEQTPLLYPQQVLDQRKETKEKEQEKWKQTQNEYLRKPELGLPKDDEQEAKLKGMQYVVDHRLDGLHSKENIGAKFVEGLQRISPTPSNQAYKSQQLLEEVRNHLRPENPDSVEDRVTLDETVKGDGPINTRRDSWEYAYGKIQPLAFSNVAVDDSEDAVQKKTKAKLGTFHLKTQMDTL